MNLYRKLLIVDAHDFDMAWCRALSGELSYAPGTLWPSAGPL